MSIGKRLFSLVLIVIIFTSQSNVSAAGIIATPSSANVYVNGDRKSFDTYNINGNTYFKLRDLAYALMDTQCQFDVTWDNSKKAIGLVSNKCYIPIKGDMSRGDGKPNAAVINKSPVYKDNVEIELEAYTINGSNYFKLRDVAGEFGFNVVWDEDTKSIGINTRILPDNSSRDFACYLFLDTAGTVGADFMYMSDYPIKEEAMVKYDIILPKDFVLDFKAENSKIVFSSWVDACDINWNSADRSEDNIAEIYMKDGQPVYYSELTGKEQFGEDCGKYYKLRAVTSSTFESSNSGMKLQNIALRQRIQLKESDYRGVIYFDNMVITSGEETILSYDFNSRFGEYGRENMETACSGVSLQHMLWGDLSSINRELDGNVLCASVVFNDIPKEENFHGITIAFSDGYELAREMTMCVDVVIPKAVFDGFKNKESNFLIGVDLVIDDQPDINTGIDGLINISDDGTICYNSGDGSYYTPGNTGQDAAIKIEEYYDCYVFHLSGTTNYEPVFAENIWIKTKTAANNCKYNGYWYLDNYRLIDDNRVIISYDVESDPLPANLSQLYDHGRNGYDNSITDATRGFYHMGFDTIAFPQLKRNLTK